MGEIKILLKNCKLIIEGEEVLKDILIYNGKIENIGNNLESKTKIIDVNGKIVLPGLIDPHVHFRDPGLTHKEDFLSGSKAAAAGGVTTFIDMPNTIPPTTTIDLLNEKRKLAEKSIVNFGFHFGGANDNLEEIKNVTNVASTKIFLNVSTGKLMLEDDNLIQDIFENSKLVSVHAEDEQVERAINFAKKSNTKLYLCHISQKSEFDMINNSTYYNLFVEVTPHHLFLSEEDVSDFNIMKPELRSKKDQDFLWIAIENDLVDTIGTDHAPHLVEEKLEKTTYGVSGIESMLPLLLDAYNKNKISLQKIQDLCCENPARIFGIKNKGIIKVGFDADLTIVDLDLEKEVKKEDLHTKCGWTPYQGKVLKGWPIMTIVNGNIVFENNIIHEDIKGKEVIFDEN